MGKAFAPCRSIKDVVESLIEESGKIYIEDGCIVLDFTACPYCIALTRCNTPEKILGWLNQLCHKNWMTAERLCYFARVAFEQLGIKLDYWI